MRNLKDKLLSRNQLHNQVTSKLMHYRSYRLDQRRQIMPVYRHAQQIDFIVIHKDLDRQNIGTLKTLTGRTLARTLAGISNDLLGMPIHRHDFLIFMSLPMNFSFTLSLTTHQRRSSAGTHYLSLFVIANELFLHLVMPKFSLSLAEQIVRDTDFLVGTH